MGFVPGRKAHDNMIKAINIHSDKILSIDAEKVFVSVGWDYMDAVLVSIGLENVMQANNHSSYSNTQARVK